MKKILISMLACMALEATCQSRTEKLQRELDFEIRKPENTLIVENINGYIKVEGYDGTSVQVVVEKKVSAKTEERLEEGFRKIQLGVIDRADTLIFLFRACA
jgi:hypothetical protein